MNVVEACENNWEQYKSDCSGFVKAVADELLILLPGSTGDADWMTKFISEWAVTDGNMIAIPAGEGADIRAIAAAGEGHFVIGGLTKDEINTARPPDKQTSNGHVVIVVPGISPNGWPMGYWGTLGGVGEKNASLSKAFRSPLKNKIHYFYVRRPQE